MSDLAPIMVALLSGIALLGAVGAWVVSYHRQRRLVNEAKEWLLVEGTIESGAFERTHDSKMVLPTFSFSYQVAGQFFSGRFCLLPERLYFPKPFIESIITDLKGRKFLLRHDPSHPEIWFIPAESIDGYKIGQRIGIHVVRSFYPD